ncbi:G1/S-specific cyclin-E isoform X2 [Eupeodes corollae]|uniref:G1/S-specific cyclin-E isoform X2 n=1 Tax=Eupeodes corollae TaxID=290404 RepID=UPI0024930B21|nr:G1/S-specific cyclin-E isoform X2 [Eupeodes corollae]
MKYSIKRTFMEMMDPELGHDGPSAKRQHIGIDTTTTTATTTCYTTNHQNSDPSSSVPSSVYPSPVDEFVEIDTRSSDCVAHPTYSLPTPESPNSIEDEIIPESSSIGSFETASTTSDSESNQETQPDGHRKVKSFDDYVSMYDCMTPIEPSEPRSCPLPALSWANASDVWNFMCKKDEAASYLRDSTMLDNHPGLQPRMRAILLDWLIEVCEVYKLHRETYYLAVDYLDRYLSTQKRVQKTHLQLIGITCLFIAAKVEEIYPPKIAEFAYVTDGACLEEDILQHELILLQALDWSISPMTAMGWLGVYMQLNVSNRTPASLAGNSAPASTTKKEGAEFDDTFIYPKFSGLEYVQTAQLLDLCSLDVGIGNFPYSVIAAAAISHTFNKETALRVSGLDWITIQPCARWMEPFFIVISEESEHLYLMEQNEQLTSKCGMSYVCPNIVTDDSHIIQTHTTSMAMFDRAYLISEQNSAMEKTIKTEASPATGLKCPEGLLTPPSSSRKPLDDDGNDDDCQSENHRVQTTKLSSSSTSSLASTTSSSSSSLSSSSITTASLKENPENVPNLQKT